MKLIKSENIKLANESKKLNEDFNRANDRIPRLEREIGLVSSAKSNLVDTECPRESKKPSFNNSEIKQLQDDLSKKIQVFNLVLKSDIHDNAKLNHLLNQSQSRLSLIERQFIELENKTKKIQQENEALVYSTI